MDYNEIKDLINQIGNSNIDEIALELPDGTKINVKKNHAMVEERNSQNNLPSIEKKQEMEKQEEKKEESQNYQEIKSPMVGTFYSKSSPKASPFVKVGDKVYKGQTLCIIEAMKLMNEIESEQDGEIVDICAKDDEMVEFGQVLFKIK